MATMIACGGCKAEVSEKATACPKCGHPNDRKDHTSGGRAVVALAMSAFGAWYLFGGGLDAAAERQMRQIESKVAQDAVQQYEIAKGHGDRIQICVQAGLVSAAYLQAKDTANFHKWKGIEERECNDD